jgi:uncharacterized protein YjbI with pentapeptide repeats
MSVRDKNKYRLISISLMGPLILFVAATLFWGYHSRAHASEQSKLTDHEELQKEKLRQEIRKLQLDNEKLNNPWEVILSYSPFFTVLVAAMGILVTIWKQIYESSRQRKLDRDQREVDSMRRLDEKFTSIVTNLGSDSPPLQASAAVSVMTFLRPEYKAFYEQVFLILLANLKIKHNKVINKLLITAFSLAIRKYLEYAQENDKNVELDLSHSYLDRVDLSGLDINQADVAFAQLRSANLTNANLHRVRGMKAILDKARLSRANLYEARFRQAQFRDAQFHEANIGAADLKETDLRGAQFHQAKMQSAHLDNAKLIGARFEQANLDNTFFYGASLDDLQTLKSIINAQKWEKAHFDDEIKTKLEKLAKDRD